MTPGRRPSAVRPLLAALAAVATLGAAGVALAQLRAYPVVPPEDPVRPPPAPEEREHASRRAVAGMPFHDPANPDLRHLQPYEAAVAGLPHDANGYPDWMRALREGSITPRANLRDGESMTVLDMDVIMRNTKEMPWVRFPHRAHTLWLDCSNCHPEPFAAKAGTNPIRMADIFRGRYCGMCHDRVAFITFFSCFRCHSVPQAAAGR